MCGEREYLFIIDFPLMQLKRLLKTRLHNTRELKNEPKF
jgi:hypothetical protein